MKNKILFTICMFLLLFIIFFLQIYLVDGKSLFGVKPNIILISVVVFSCFASVYLSVIYSFLIGFLTDILYGSNYGIFLISYLVVAIIISLMNKNYQAENKNTLILITFIGTALFEIFEYVIYAIVYSNLESIFFLIKQIIIASIFNVAIVYILNGIVQKIAEYFKVKARERDVL